MVGVGIEGFGVGGVRLLVVFGFVCRGGWGLWWWWCSIVLVVVLDWLGFVEATTFPSIYGTYTHTYGYTHDSH